MEDLAPEAQFRHANTGAGTEFEVQISGWELSFNLSPKYVFEGEMKELSGREVNARTIKFQLTLSKDLHSAEWAEPTVNDLAIRIDRLPNLRRVSGLETMFKELAHSNRSLTISVSSEYSILGPTLHDNAPFEYGFDFDMNPSSYRHTIRPATYPVATHLIFSQKEFPAYLRTSHSSQNSPEYAIKVDEELKGVDTFVNLGADYWMRVRYGGTAMYRLAAVGHKIGTEGRRPTGGRRFL